jgi:hypothetical protein
MSTPQDLSHHAVDLQAAETAILVIRSALAVTAALDRVCLTGVEHPAAGAANVLASMPKPLACTGRVRNQRLEIDCRALSAEEERFHHLEVASTRDVLFSAQARKALHATRDPAVLILGGEHNLKLPPAALDAFRRTYRIDLPLTLAGRSPTRAERRDGTLWVLEVWDMGAGAFFVDEHNR